jgi:hypothetical protein
LNEFIGLDICPPGKKRAGNIPPFGHPFDSLKHSQLRAKGMKKSTLINKFCAIEELDGFLPFVPFLFFICVFDFRLAPMVNGPLGY